ncbi:hypothetical protein Tco_1488167, partial [Tanacetum coccineum]
MINSRDEAGSGSEVEDGVFWRGATGFRVSCLVETIWDPSTFDPRVYYEEEDDMETVYLGIEVTHRAGDVEAGFGAYWAGSHRLIPDKGDLRDYWIEISSDRDFLGLAPSYVLIRYLVRRLCHKMIAYSIFGRGQAPEKVTGVDLFYLRNMDRRTTNVPHLLVQYLFRHVEGRK